MKPVIYYADLDLHVFGFFLHELLNKYGNILRITKYCTYVHKFNGILTLSLAL